MYIYNLIFLIIFSLLRALAKLHDQVHLFLKETFKLTAMIETMQYMRRHLFMSFYTIT